MKQPNWDEYEVALLIDTYFSIKKNNINKNSAIKDLSNNLRKMAINRGIVINDVFRNENGINMRLYEIEGILSNGTYGLKNTSELFRKMIWLYINNQASFNTILNIAKIQIELIEENSCMIQSTTIDETNNSKTQKTFADAYKINPEFYKNLPIEEIGFSVRTFNRLKRAEINSISDLLNLNCIQLASLKNIGQKSVDEVTGFLKSLKFEESFEESFNSNKSLRVITNNKKYIAKGDFSFSENSELSFNDKEIVKHYEEAYTSLGPELVHFCMYESNKVVPIIKSLNEFSKKTIIIQKRTEESLIILKEIPTCRKQTSLKKLFPLYCHDNDKISAFLNKLPYEDIKLSDCINSKFLENDLDYYELKQFLNWCTYDIKNDFVNFVENKLFSKGKARKILEKRALGYTLEQIALKEGVTRERIRQIEAKSRKIFEKWQIRENTLCKISIERNGDEILTTSELSEYLEDYTNVALYLFRTITNSNYLYDNNLDVFVIGNLNIAENVQFYIDNLPNIFSKEKFNTFISEAKDFKLPEELVKKSLEGTYTLSGNTYHRTRLAMVEICNSILKKYFSQGIHVYDDKELEKFKLLIIKEFGETNFSNNNRALTARISDAGILCGRGIYKPKQKSYISKQLLADIKDYIDFSDQIVFLTNSIFEIFKERLIAEGITNKYYLQGVLHELCKNDYVFRRDYISKDESVTSLSFEIINYIKSFEYPVPKEMIINKFPGVTEIVLNLALNNDNSIVNYFGKYIHLSKLNLYDNDKKLLRHSLEWCLDTNKNHAKDLYAIVKKDYPEMLDRLGITFPYQLFSLVKCLFEKDFEFERSYFAKKGSNIIENIDRLQSYVSENDFLFIQDLIDYAKQIHFVIYSTLDFITSFNSTHLLVNSTSLCLIEKIGLQEDMAIEIEGLIFEEIDSCVPIRNLSCISNFRKINYDWNEWMIYSVLHKWSTKLDVATTDTQFRYAIPLVAPKGIISDDIIASYNHIDTKFIPKVDDLSNIDELIMDMIDFDLNFD